MSWKCVFTSFTSPDSFFCTEHSIWWGLEGLHDILVRPNKKNYMGFYSWYISHGCISCVSPSFLMGIQLNYTIYPSPMNWDLQSNTCHFYRHGEVTQDSLKCIFKMAFFFTGNIFFSGQFRKSHTRLVLWHAAYIINKCVCVCVATDWCNSTESQKTGDVFRSYVKWKQAHVQFCSCRILWIHEKSWSCTQYESANINSFLFSSSSRISYILLPPLCRQLELAMPSMQSCCIEENLTGNKSHRYVHFPHIVTYSVLYIQYLLTRWRSNWSPGVRSHSIQCKCHRLYPVVIFYWQIGASTCKVGVAFSNTLPLCPELYLGIPWTPVDFWVAQKAAAVVGEVRKLHSTHGALLIVVGYNSERARHYLLTVAKIALHSEKYEINWGPTDAHKNWLQWSHCSGLLIRTPPIFYLWLKMISLYYPPDN